MIQNLFSRALFPRRSPGKLEQNLGDSRRSYVESAVRLQSVQVYRVHASVGAFIAHPSIEGPKSKELNENREKRNGSDVN